MTNPYDAAGLGRAREQHPTHQPARNARVRIALFAAAVIMFGLLVLASVVWMLLRHSEAHRRTASDAEIAVKESAAAVMDDIRGLADGSGPPMHVYGTFAHFDMQSEVLIQALEAYRADHGAYPASTSDAGLAIAPPYRIGLDQFSTFRDLSLTKPVQYLERIPFDIYAPRPATPYMYYSPHPSKYLLWSAGPDGDYDIGRADWWDGEGVAPDSVLMRTYDPDNGTNSDGDIWFKKP